MATKLISADPNKPGVMLINGPTLNSSGKLAISGLDGTGAAVDDVIKFDGSNWVAGVAPTTGANVGVGTAQIFRDKTSNNLNIKTLVAGSGITLLNGANEITINSTAAISGVFTESYTSPAQTITLAGSLSLNHGMTGTPTLINAVLTCTSAEKGYSVNDQLFIANDTEVGGGGMSVVGGATNIDIRFSNAAFVITQKNDGVQNTIDPAKWTITFRAWR